MQSSVESYATSNSPKPSSGFPSASIAEADLALLRSEFDADFYRSQHPVLRDDKADPLVHFVLAGWREGRDPAPWFSVEAYLEHHDDVRRSEINPFLHYLRHGRQEGREVADSRKKTLLSDPVIEPS